MKNSIFWFICFLIVFSYMLFTEYQKHGFAERQRLAMVDQIVRTCDIIYFDYIHDIAEYACHDDRPSVRINVTVPELAVALDKWRREFRK